MNIVQIGAYPLSPNCIHGGIESSVYGLVKQLSMNHTVDVFDYPRLGGQNRVDMYGQITVNRYANKGVHNVDAVKSIEDYLRDIIALHPDVCHVHGTGPFSKAMYMSLKNYGIPVILTVHGLLKEEKWQSFKRKPSLKHLYQFIVQTHSEKGLLRCAPMAIVDTEYVKEKIKGYNLRFQPELYVIPQGIDNSYYDLKCDPQSKVILSVGSIGPRKGHVYTYNMFKMLCSNGVDARLRIIGSMADENYYKQLQGIVKEDGFESRVSIEVNLPHEELLKAYSSSKLFVLHSREESQGIAFAEAMAAGLPVVATNVGGIPHVVENGKCGLLCDYGDVRTMMEMCGKLLENHDLWNAFSESARNKSMEYNWGRIASEIENLYSKIS